MRCLSASVSGAPEIGMITTASAYARDLCADKQGECRPVPPLPELDETDRCLTAGGFRLLE
jgi:hypothetical protein